MQIQRGKLNTTIAKMAQEKGDLIREKVNLGAEVTQLQESLRVSEERLASLKAVKERLEGKVDELEKRLVHAELNQSTLEEANLALQQEKHDLVLENDGLSRRKEEECSQMQSEKGLKLQQTPKAREGDLQDSIQETESTGEARVRDLQVAHSLEVASLNEQHREVVVQLRSKIESLTKVQKADLEVSRLLREKELAVSSLEDEKALLAEQISKLQKLFDEKCDESRYQLEHANHLATEQKVGALFRFELFEYVTVARFYSLKSAPKSILHLTW